MTYNSKRTVTRGSARSKFIDNIERDNEVKKIKRDIVCNRVTKNFIRDYNFKGNERKTETCVNIVK